MKKGRMALIRFTPEETAKVKRMLEDLEHPFNPLTPKQQRFVDSCRDYFTRNGAFGQSKLPILEAIHRVAVLKLPLPGEWI